ncbi:MAG TPA: hypothetical protein VKC89_03315 [Patescibacteria group bacterium]|nr:hypothetical protein [Patescibacteria group bacterium]
MAGRETLQESENLNPTFPKETSHVIAIQSFFRGRNTQMGPNQEIYNFQLKQIEDKMTFFQFRGRIQGKLVFYLPNSRRKQRIAFSEGGVLEPPSIKWVAEIEGGGVKKLPKARKSISFVLKENKPIMTVSLERLDRISKLPSSWIRFEVSDKEATILKTELTPQGREVSVSDAFKALQA